MEWINIILTWIWMVIVTILFVFIILGNIIKKQDTDIWKGFLFTEGNVFYLEKVLLKFLRLFMWNVLSIVVIMGVNIINDDFFEYVSKWLSVTFIPLAWERIMNFWGENKKNKHYTYNFELFVLLLGVCMFRILGLDVYDEPLFVSCVSMIVSCVFDVFVQYCITSVNNIRNKISMHKDLDYRTPRLTYISDAYSHIKEMEIMFEKYNSSFRRCNDIESISLNPTCKVPGDEQQKIHITSYIDEWYKCIVKVWYVYLIFNIFYVLLSVLFLNYNVIMICSLLLFSLFILLIFIKKDYYLFKRIMVRFFFEEWNYVVKYKRRDKEKKTYSSMTKLLRRTKYCKYVWSVLDFVAYFRAVSFYDKINDTKNIKLLSSNMQCLFDEYELKNEKNIFYKLPLWICGLFEYSLLGESVMKDTLSKLYNDCKSNQISIVLYSIWLHVTRKMDELDRGVVYDFMMYIKS